MKDRGPLFTRPKRQTVKTVREVREANGHQLPTSLGLTTKQRDDLDAYCRAAKLPRGAAVAALLATDREARILRAALEVRHGPGYAEQLLTAHLAMTTRLETEGA